MSFNKSLVLVAGLVSLGSGAAAGGIDRSGQGVGILFESGTVAELGFGRSDPTIKGVSVPLLGNRPSGDMAKSVTTFGLGYKQQVSDRLALAVILDAPFGADIAYPTATGFYAAGWTSEFSSRAVTALGRYALGDGFSVHGGMSYQDVSARIALPNVGGTGVNYTSVGKQTGGFGAIAGAAYERPEVGLRVALTWRSAIDYDVATTETLTGLPGAIQSTTSISTPQSVNLDVQTGIAPDTLLIASARWVEWTAFSISPQVFNAAISPAPLVSYANDTITYNLGIARKFNEAWSASASLGFEAGSGLAASILGPTDGNRSISLGAQYTDGPVKVAFGLRYAQFGDTFTNAILSPAANFRDNDAVAFGVKLTYSF